jgi:hypothetical protein
MTRRERRALPSILLTTSVVLLAAACERHIVDPSPGQDMLVAQFAKGGKKKNPPPTPEPEPDPEPNYLWYVEAVNDDYDPLYRFGIEGDEVLLRTDPSVTSWGEDFWGYWDEPYTMVDNKVIYTIGLTHTTYTFVPLPSGGFDVRRRLIRQPYPVGTPDTTFTHVGIFERED